MKEYCVTFINKPQYTCDNNLFYIYIYITYTYKSNLIKYNLSIYFTIRFICMCVCVCFLKFIIYAQLIFNKSNFIRD